MRTRRWTIMGLLAINAVLAGGLAMRYWPESTAYGQARGRAALVTIPGHVNNRMVFFVMDANAGLLGVVRSDVQNKSITAAATVNVANDMTRAFKK